MKTKEKKMIIILVVVAIIIIAILLILRKPKDDVGESTNNPVASVDQQNTKVGEFAKVEQDGTITNTSQKVKESREMEGFKLSNINLKEVSGETILSARITNITDKKQESFFGNIVLLDKANNEIGRIPVKVSETESGETIEIEASITESYVNAYNFRLEK